MADFAGALAKTALPEGGYADHPSDRGGETWAGIARKKHPGWPGWALVDEIKARVGTARRAELDAALRADSELERLRVAFYRHEFWDAIRGDVIASQSIAEELFDTGVNMGPPVAVRFLQRALNAFNRRGKLWPNLPESGLFLDMTEAALSRALRVLPDAEVNLLKALNVQQGARYLSLAREDETQEDFMRGWFGRVEITKSNAA